MLSEGARGRAGTTGRSWRHDRLLTSKYGTKPTWPAWLAMSGLGGRREVGISGPLGPLLTQLRHGRLQTFAAQEHCSSLGQA
jgi:hypothetical protein